MKRNSSYTLLRNTASAGFGRLISAVFSFKGKSYTENVKVIKHTETGSQIINTKLIDGKRYRLPIMFSIKDVKI